MSVEIRASDEDRERIIAALQRHTEAGRLSLDEFSERVAAAIAARTLGDLAAVTGDLPAEPPPAAGPASGGTQRDLLAVFAVAVLTLALLTLYMTLIR